MRISDNGLNSDFVQRVGLTNNIRYFDEFSISTTSRPNTLLTIIPLSGEIYIEQYGMLNIYRKFVVEYSSDRSKIANDKSELYTTYLWETLDALDDFMYEHKSINRDKNYRQADVASGLFRSFMQAQYPNLLKVIPTVIFDIKRTEYRVR